MADRGGPDAGPAAGGDAFGGHSPADHRGGPLPGVIAALFVAGLAFRAPVLVVGPLLPEIRADLGIGHAVAGLLSSIPVLCMALLAPLGPILARSVGPRPAVAACIAATAGFGLLRAVAPGAALVVLLTVGVGLGMGMVGPILPLVVRASAPRHPTLGTGAYAMGYIVGASLATAVAIPVAAALGGWRGAFAAIGAGSLGCLIIWWLLAPGGRHVRVAPRWPDLPWRRPLGWSLGVAFGLQSVLFYSAVAWLPSIYIERGWQPADAAGLVAFFAALGIPTTLLVPLVADRFGSRRTQLVLASAVTLAGALGVALATGDPTGALGSPAAAFGSVLLLGFGIGVFFPIVLTLPIDVARTPSESSSLAALMLLVGYTISAVGPVVLGALRDATGDFRAAGWILAGVAVLLLAATLLLSDRRLRARARRVPA